MRHRLSRLLAILAPFPLALPVSAQFLEPVSEVEVLDTDWRGRREALEGTLEEWFEGAGDHALVGLPTRPGDRDVALLRLRSIPLAVRSGSSGLVRARGWLEGIADLQDPKGSLARLTKGLDPELGAAWIQAALAFHAATGEVRILEGPRRLADSLRGRIDRGVRLPAAGGQGLERRLLELAEVLETSGKEGEGDALRELAIELLERPGLRLGGGDVGSAPVLESAGDPRAIEDLRAVTAVALRTRWEDYWDASLRGFHDRMGGELRRTGTLVSAGDSLLSSVQCALWHQELMLMSGHAVHADRVEEILFNRVAGALTKEGESLAAPESVPVLEAPEVAFALADLLAGAGEMIYATDGPTVYVSQFIASRARIDLPDGELEIEQRTDFPRSGKVELHIRCEQPRMARLAIRAPGWCQRVTVGPADSLKTFDVAHGPDPGVWLIYDRVWRDGERFLLELDVSPRLLNALPQEAPADHLALARGPVVHAFRTPRPEGFVYPMPVGPLRLEGRCLVGPGPGGTEPDTWQSTPISEGFSPRDSVLWAPSLPEVRESDVGFARLHDGFLRVHPGPADLPALVDGRGLEEERAPALVLHLDPGGAWVRRDFDEPRSIAGCNVVFLADKGTIPAEWSCETWDDADRSWQPVHLVEGSDSLLMGTEEWSRLRFDTVLTRSMRIVVAGEEGDTLGLLEWELVE